MSNLSQRLPVDWRHRLSDQFGLPYWADLESRLTEEYRNEVIYPPIDEVFTAFHLTPFHAVRAVILGQDPYPNAGQGHGLSFSVKPGVALPASLRNIFKELADDIGIPPVRTGYLARWAEQGVLMLNAVLTVQEKKPNSHRRIGWESFTDAVMAILNNRPDPLVFVFWGKDAAKKGRIIDRARHGVIESAHPSPLSAHAGFFGSRPFSRINEFLRTHGHAAIDWRIHEAAADDDPA